MELTVLEASQRLDVSPRRVRALVERGQLPAVRRGSMWLTTSDAVDAFRRNSPGRGRPISAATAWSRIGEIASSGDFAALSAARVALRSRAVHRTYSLTDTIARRLEMPKGTLRSGLDVLADSDAGDPIDLYATPGAADSLVKQTGATPAPDGALYLHVLPADMAIPHLSPRTRLVVAWCDLADRADPAADIALQRLWPGTIEVPRLADVVRGVKSVPHTALRGFTDWLHRHPKLAGDAIADQPAPTADRELDSLIAAIAETIAEDLGIARPAWTRKVPSAKRARSGGTPPSRVLGEVPPAFERRAIDLTRDTFWHSR